jgi:methylmalonyl-CoA epimerase
LDIDHIGIAVRSVDETLRIYRSIFDTKAKNTELKSQKVRIGMIPVGEAYIELLEPTAEESSVQKFLDKRGQGLHHIAFRVKNIGYTMKKMKKEGFHFIYEKPVPGKFGSRVNFINPGETGKVLIELTEPRRK